MSDSRVFEVRKYFALALDPIYIGTGGYRIGRVDNTIVREPATGIPKVPGTTIDGVCRSYAYLRAKEDGRKDINEACAKGKKTKVTEKRKENGKETIVKVKKEPCGDCEICVTFGFTSDEKSMQAMALFSDARILLFPVATMIGPVWITCPMVLKDAGISGFLEPDKNGFVAAKELENILPSEGKNNSKKDDKTSNKILNFGWLLLKGKCGEINLTIDKIPQEILKRVVIVPDDLFATIVNSNLEVRTSVSIDPATGAAEEGALFTYEAIPRGTVLWFEVTYQNPKCFGMDAWNIEIVRKTVEDGLKYFEFLGIGGMGSRGFGRVRIYGDFLSFEEYLDALKERLSVLKSKGKEKEIQEYINYLTNLKSKMEEQKEELEKLIEKINEIINEFEGDSNGN